MTALSVQDPGNVSAQSPPSPLSPIVYGDYRMRWFKAPPAVYFGYGGTEEALKDLIDSKIQRVFVMTDRNVAATGAMKLITDRLEEFNIDYELFTDVDRATSVMVSKVIIPMQVFKPDCILACGGGVVMDVAKICRIIYDPSNSHTQLSDLYAYDHMQLLSDREEKTGVSRLPPADRHIKKLVCIPTTSGSGSEMTPVAWVHRDDHSVEFNVRPIISWRMTPDIAIVDAYFTSFLPKDVVAQAGMKAFSVAVESAASKLANDYTTALSLRSCKLIYENLLHSQQEGDQHSRSKVHNGASIGGMAAANAFLGVSHALSIVFQAFFGGRGSRLSLGACAAVALPRVIEFNAKGSPAARKSYAQIAQHCGICTRAEFSELTVEEARTKKTEKLVTAISDFIKKLGMKTTLAEHGVSREDMIKSVDRLAIDALGVVGCIASSPVDVGPTEVKAIVVACFEGKY